MPVPPQIPVIQLQSPAFGDKLLVEAWGIEVQLEDIPYGQHHPDTVKWPNYRLIKQEAVDDKWVRRYWTADPQVEDTYNAETENFDGEDINKPVFKRAYLVKRPDYTPTTRLVSLKGLLYVKVTAGGSGYDQTTTCTISGGGGSGATATPIVFRGAVVGVYVTAEGDGYTTPPYVALAGIGTGAVATAIIQHTGAVLVEEAVSRIEGQPDDGLYIKVLKTFHVLPGALFVNYSAASGGRLKRTRRQKIALPYYPSASGSNVISERVDAISTVVGWRIIEDWANSDGSPASSPWITHIESLEPENVKLVTRIKTVDSTYEAPPVGQNYLETPGDMAAGATYGGRRRIPSFPTGITNAGQWEDAQAYVVHSERRDVEDSPNKIVIVQSCPIPRTRYEFPELTFQFPALLTFNTTTFSTSLDLVNGRLPLRMDKDVTYKSHRTRRVSACLLRKYTVTPNTPTLSDQFFLNSPGAGSAFFGQIDQNTIYADLGTATYVSLSSNGSEIERFPFSTVTGCSQAANSTPGTDLTPAKGTLPALYRLKAEEMVWRGAIYVREYLCVGEDRDLIADANNGRFNSTTDTSAGTWLWCA